MQKKQFIGTLTFITLTVLAGIIALQVYWIIASYQQQKSRFITDIQNALSSANVKTTFKIAYARKTDDGLSNVFDLNSLIETVGGLKDQKRNGAANASSKLSSNSLLIKDSLKLLEYLKKAFDPAQTTATSATFEITNKDMELYKASFQYELDSREIDAPFELAVVNKEGGIAWSTCDSSHFKDIAFKSQTDAIPQIRSNSNSDFSWGLRAAFPDANFYLLRKLMWILSVSILLIFIGSYSLGYLLIFFFNQKKLADMRTDFINNMTHELKTPISSVSVALEMVLDESKKLDPEKKQAYLHIAQKELNRLDLLTETILKIISVEKAEIKIVKSQVKLLPWLKGITESISPLLVEKSGKVNLNVIPESIEISIDKVHMANVIYNIIENAIKYNDKTSPEIKITATRHDNHLIITLSDNGEGIPDQYLKNIFDKFFRVPKGNRHNVKGYGLGLSYVKGIVEMHHGTINVSSVHQIGSTFTIDLPIN